MLLFFLLKISKNWSSLTNYSNKKPWHIHYFKQDRLSGGEITKKVKKSQWKQVWRQSYSINFNANLNENCLPVS